MIYNPRLISPSYILLIRLTYLHFSLLHSIHITIPPVCLSIAILTPVRNEFYKDTQGCILVYDVSQRESYEDLDSWLNEATKYGANPRDMPIALCANKIDAKKRVVSEDEGRQYAVSRGLMYFETSASSGQNVNEMFEYLFREIVRHSDQ